MHHCSSEPWWLEVQHSRWSSAPQLAQESWVRKLWGGPNGHQGSRWKCSLGPRSGWLTLPLTDAMALYYFSNTETKCHLFLYTFRLSGNTVKTIGRDTLKSHQSAKFSSFLFSQSFSPQYPSSYYWFCRPLLLSSESTLPMRGLRVSTLPRFKFPQNVPLFCSAMDLSRLQTPLPIRGGHQQLSGWESLAQTLLSD